MEHIAHDRLADLSGLDARARDCLRGDTRAQIARRDARQASTEGSNRGARTAYDHHRFIHLNPPGSKLALSAFPAEGDIEAANGEAARERSKGGGIPAGRVAGPGAVGDADEDHREPEQRESLVEGKQRARLRVH
jgi:hypothetical protein